MVQTAMLLLFPSICDNMIRAVEILYPPLLQGDYTFTIHSAAIKDRAGNAIGRASDPTSTFSITATTRQPTIRWVNNAGGAWSRLQ